MKKFDVIGFGALNVDLFYNIGYSFAKRFSVRAGKEYKGKNLPHFLTYLEKEKFVGKSGGGQSANTVYALSRMGFSTGFIGKVGNDSYGNFLIDSFDKVDTAYVNHEGLSGMLFSLTTDQKEDRAMFVFPNANDTIYEQDVHRDYLNQTRFLHLSSFVGNISFNTQKKIIEYIDPSVRIALNPGDLYARRGIKALLPIIKKTHVLFVSENETYLLSWEDNYKKAARYLLTKGPKIVVVTLGEKGSHVFTKEENFFVPAENIKKVVDTTGAGDVYAAGFLAGLLKHKSLKTCATFASKVAAKSITGVGRTHYPTRKDIAIKLLETL